MPAGCTRKAEWSTEYGTRWLARLQKDVFPWIGKLPVAEVEAPQLLATLRRVEARGVRELAHSLREACNMRQMKWAELDLDFGMWTIPAAMMKRTKEGKVNGRPHLVPLACQAVAMLRYLHPLTSPAADRPGAHRVRRAGG